MANQDEAKEDVPGDFLGNFKVDAVLLESSCGGGTLEAPNIWDFEVKLSRDDSHIYWSNGAEAIQGELSSDGNTFGFTTEVASTLKEAKPGRPGCVVWRQDSMTGDLTVGLEKTDIQSFLGKLTYTYAPGSGSECGEVLDESGLTQLPCIIRYDIKGARLDD